MTEQESKIVLPDLDKETVALAQDSQNISLDTELMTAPQEGVSVERRTRLPDQDPNKVRRYLEREKLINSGRRNNTRWK